MSTTTEHPAGNKPLLPVVDPPASGGTSPWTRTDQRIVSTLVVLLVVTQRLGVPIAGTPIAIALPLTYAAVVALAVRRRLQVGRLRAEMLLLALAACLATAAAVGLRGSNFSVFSLLLLVAIYLPWVLQVNGGDRGAICRHAGRTFLGTMVVIAAIGVAQLAAQLAGVWRYVDLLATSLPATLLVPNYNPTIPLQYGSAIVKANGFVMLEPSFLSQYCALAVIIGLVLRVRLWQLIVLLLGLASAVSGTGILLLVGGSILLLVRARHVIRPAYLFAAAVALVVMLSGPVAPYLLDRTPEVTVAGSSGNARFVAPYSVVYRALEREPVRYLIGQGPGTDQTLTTSGDPEAAYANYSVVPKLAYEYGLVAGSLFVLFLLVGLLDGVVWHVVPGALVIMTFLLSGALLQPQTVGLAWVLTGLCAADRDRFGQQRRRSG